MKKLVLSLVAAVSVASAAFAAEKERVVIVPCHPDDLVAAFGFCLLARDVYDLHVVDYTRGERGCGPVNYTNGMAAAMRTAEEEAVCADLGAKLYWLDQPDGAALVTEEAVDRLSEILNELKPRAVIGHWPVDIHGDHTMAGAAMLKAVCNVDEGLQARGLLLRPAVSEQGDDAGRLSRHHRSRREEKRVEKTLLLSGSGTRDDRQGRFEHGGGRRHQGRVSA